MTMEGFKRKLTTILSADVEGYSRLMSEDEAQTVKTLTAYREILTELIKQHRGRVVDSPGDNVLAEFTSVVDGVQCAVAVQKELQARNTELPEDRRMEFRIGINLGDVIEEEDRIYGDGVNIAARLESLADPGGICISKTAFDHIETKLPLGYEYLGEQAVKNIAKPVAAYKVLMEPRVVVAGAKEKKPLAPFWGRKSVLAGAIGVLVMIIGVVVWNFSLRAPKIEPASVERMAFELPDKPSIAVLPFENLSGDPKQEYLSDGISEAIISALSKVPRLFVIARNSSFTYKGKPVKVQQVAEELGVQYVLEGSVQRSGEKLRVTAQLIDALKGHHLWSERYDFKMDDLLAVQDKIALNVLVETQVKLTEGEQARLLRKETNNLKAYEKHLEASMYYHRANREDMFKARQLFEEAIRLDPDFSSAYRGVAVTHSWDSVRRWSKDPDKSWELAVEYAQKALALDEDNSGNLLLMSGIHERKGDYEKAIEIARRAVEISPNSAGYIEFLAGRLFSAGRYEEAIPLQEKAGRLNPFPPARYFRNSGLYYWFAGRYEEAIAASKKALHISPDDITTFRNLAAIYATLGEEEEARAAAAEVLRLDPSFSIEREFKNMPWKDREGMERYMDALHKAGLPETPPLPLPDKPSIAVLPFTNISDDPEQEYFADGMTDDLITDLSKISGLFVIARNSTFTYKGKPVKVDQVGRELGIRYVLEGSVRKAGDQVRINAQLIDATTGGHLWAERYDGKMDNVFALQDKITQKIVTALALKLTGGEQKQVTRKETDNIAAYDAFLKGWGYYHRRTPEDWAKAVSYFKKAIEFDPNYSRAYAALASLYYWSYRYWWFYSLGIRNLFDVYKLASHYTQMAMKNPTSHAYWNASQMSLHYHQHERAIAEVERAIALDPNDPDIFIQMARVLIFAGRPEEAVGFIKRAMRLDPHYPAEYQFIHGLAYFAMGQLEEAVTLLESAVRRNPDVPLWGVALAVTYAHLGRDQEAHAMYDRIGYQYFSTAGDAQFKWPFKDPEVADRFTEGLRKARMK